MLEHSKGCKATAVPSCVEQVSLNPATVCELTLVSIKRISSAQEPLDATLCVRWGRQLCTYSIMPAHSWHTVAKIMVFVNARIGGDVIWTKTLVVFVNVAKVY